MKILMSLIIILVLFLSVVALVQDTKLSWLQREVESLRCSEETFRAQIHRLERPYLVTEFKPLKKK